MSEAKDRPLKVAQICGHALDYQKSTELHGIPHLAIAGKKGLNLAMVTMAEKTRDGNGFDYASIVAEMRAFGPVQEVTIDSNHKFIIGSTPGLDAHTYLRLESKTVVDEFRRQQTLGMNPDAITMLNLPESGLPSHIVPHDPAKPTYLPLHFVNWCVLEDSTNGSARYSAFDALSFYADGNGKLTQLGCDASNAQKSIQEAHRKMVELSLRNREVVAKLYNEHLRPKIVKRLIELDKDNPRIINHAHIPTGDNLEDFLTRQLTCNPQNQRVYTNIGHSPPSEREEYDTGRGPATLETLHSFTRYLLIDRLSMLVGEDPNAHLTTEEYELFKQLINAVGRVIPGIGDSELLTQKRLESMAARELSQYIKMLDPYSDYLATYSIPILNTVLSHTVGDMEGVKIIVDQREHMAAATSLVADHGKSLMIRVRPDNTQNDLATLDDVTFGANLMDKIFPPLQQFMSDYNRTYKAIFEYALTTVPDKNTIRSLLNDNFSKYQQWLNPDEIENLADALAQLRPTAKMEDTRSVEGESGEVIEKDGKSRDNHIRANDLIVSIIQLFIDNAEGQSSLQQLISQGSLTLESFRGFLKSRNLEPSTLFAQGDTQYGNRTEEIWRMAFSTLQQHCFSAEASTLTLTEKMVQSLTIATLGLERRGVRITKGGRPENIPRIPSLLMSYRVRTNSDGIRELEVEMGIAAGQAASVEKVTGVNIKRITDLSGQASQK